MGDLYTPRVIAFDTELEPDVKLVKDTLDFLEKERVWVFSNGGRLFKSE